MKYDFDKQIERRRTNCVKWDESPDREVIPMWVADMDFRVAPAIEDALTRRVAHGVFGYNIVPDSYYQAVISWFHRCTCHVGGHQGTYHAWRTGTYPVASI